MYKRYDINKIIILTFILLLCTGCIKVNDVDSYDIIVDNIINESSNVVNTTSMGYKYYLPIGVSRVYDKDYNQKFKVEDTYIYLYVDAVSYYYNNTLNFSLNDDNSYYYRKISDNEKNGYIKITEEDENYFISIVYNCAKVESYVSKPKLNSILTYSMIILDSIEYNDNLIKKILDDEYFSSVDEEYKIEKPENTESKFSEYLSEYVQEDESAMPDLPEY